MSRAERTTGAALGALAEQVRPLALAGERVLPVVPALAVLLPPGGLQRGSTVVVSAGPAHPVGGFSTPQGATSLALSLVAAASAGGAWGAVVGLPDLGLVAAAELGLVLERLALVPHAPPEQWVTVLGALLDAVDVVIARPPAHLRPGDARRLTARARERGAVLIPVLPDGAAGGAGRCGPWAEGAGVRLEVAAGRWEGPGAGGGHLVRRRLEVTASGRGAAARPRRVVLWLPAPGGGIDVADEGTPAVSAPAYAGADIDLISDPALERGPGAAGGEGLAGGLPAAG